ncbi:MAG: hypothetical protein HY518_02095 [Candidatus Aenigmarchaeota archaeon]|nr:hypothetical protein [Candidatus Aenigmarchaeota archaeon]
MAVEVTVHRYVFEGIDGEPPDVFYLPLQITATKGWTAGVTGDDNRLYIGTYGVKDIFENPPEKDVVSYIGMFGYRLVSKEATAVGY